MRGAEIDGEEGKASMPQDRLLGLPTLTCALVNLGICTVSTLSSLLGMWVGALLCRRPMLCLLERSFKEKIPESETELFLMNKPFKEELCVLLRLLLTLTFKLV